MKIAFAIVVCMLAAWWAPAHAQIDPGNIEIIRDRYGVPHIFAPTDAEVAYGLAWAHSEDDFPSIFQNLLLSRARLGELLGVEGAKMDFFVHFTGARERIKTPCDQPTSPAYQKVMEGYVAGLNAYAAAHPKDVPLKGVIPFTTEDLEVAFAVTFCAMSGLPMAMEATLENKPYRSPISWGSNGIAVSPRASDNGETFLVNDPHWLTDGSLTFYEVHLESEEGWSITGGCYPGTPMPVNAVNRHLGWNLPFNFPDLVDIYAMKVNPDNPNQYRYDGKWENFRVQKVPLKVKTPVGKLTVKKEILWCQYGPALRTDHGVFAFRIYALDCVGAGEQLYRMGKTQSLKEFRKVGEMHRLPLFNIIYADAKGNITYHYGAWLRERDTLYNWGQTLPGDTSATYWAEMAMSWLDLPQRINPPCGYVYNTNNSPWYCACPGDEKIGPKSYPYNKYDFFDPENDRSIRFRELMQPWGQISYERLKAIKYDLDYPEAGGAIRQTWERVCALDPGQHPAIADVLDLVRAAHLDGRKENRNTALFTYAIYLLIEEKKPNLTDFLNHGLQVSEATLVDGLARARKAFLKEYGRIDPELGEVQRIVRGDKSLPVDGLPQNLNGTEAVLWKNAQLRVNRNSSFLQFVRFPKEGLPIIESVVPYGSSNRPGSAHYDDQMELHAARGLKQFEWDREKLRAGAERVYSPQ